MLTRRKETKTPSPGFYQGLAFTILLMLLIAPALLGGSRARLQAAWSETEIRNLASNYEYRLFDGSRYRLKDGQFEAGTGLDDYVNLKLAALAVGDLNADRQPEAAVILVSNFGGSGSFYELTALVNRGGDWQQTNNLELGDRVEIKELVVNDGEIRLNLLVHGPDDPSCCPSQQKSLRFRLVAGRLQLLT